MHLIDQQPHFWELYQNQAQYYLSIAVDMSSVVSCWDIHLMDSEIQAFKQRGRIVIEELANSIVTESYRGDFSNLEARAVSDEIGTEIKIAFKAWRKTGN